MSDPRPRRESSEPAQMSMAEKLACEWEARHDVAARGRTVSAAPVQHYLEHSRSEDNRHPHAAHEVRAPAEKPAPVVPLSVGGWLRSLR